jgi:hypothetical protein
MIDGPTPEQCLSANERRGYNPEFLSQICACGCQRATHANRGQECPCGCQSFRLASAPPAQTSQDHALREKYILGTIPVEGRENVDTHRALTESGILHAISMDEGRAQLAEEEGEPVVVPRDGTATRCPFCLADDFETVPSLKCPSCKAWQHAACVNEIRQCAACNVPWSQ